MTDHDVSGPDRLSPTGPDRPEATGDRLEQRLEHGLERLEDRIEHGLDTVRDVIKPRLRGWLHAGTFPAAVAAGRSRGAGLDRSGPETS